MKKLLKKWLFPNHQIVEPVERMECALKREFYGCAIHQGSTYGCLNCGQYTNKKQNNGR